MGCRRHARVHLLVVFLAVGAIAACGSKTGPAARDAAIKRGDALIAAKKTADAAIEYRNAIQADPQSGEAHRKLAEAFAEGSDYGHAIPEFIRASDLLPNDVALQVKTGGLLLLARRYEDARVRADKVLAIDPRNVDARVLKGNALAGLKDLEGAIREVQGAISSDPSKGIGYSSLAALQLARGDVARAEAEFKQALAVDPKSVAARLALANLYWATNRKSEAEKFILEALAIDPKNTLGNVALATLYLESGRGAEAEQPLKALSGALPGGAARLPLADYYFSAKRVPEATAIYRELADSKNPGESATGKLRLASVSLSTGDRPGADKLIAEVLAKDPKNIDALITRTQLELGDGHPETALATINSAVHAAPDSAPAQYVRGTILTATGQNEEAMAAHRAAMQANPLYVPSTVELARLSIIMGRYQDAVSLAQGAVQAAPGYATAQLLLARAQMAAGNLTGAQEPLKYLMANYPDEPTVQSEVGRLLYAKGDLAGAREAFGRALSKDPAQASALEGLTALDVKDKKPAPAHARIDKAVAGAPDNVSLLTLAGRLYAMVGDAALAEETLKRAIARDPNQGTAYALLAQLYAEQRRIPEAIAQFTNVAQRDAKAVAPRVQLGLLYQAQGKTAEAQAAYEQALQLDPRAPLPANNLAQIYADRGSNLDVALQLAQTAKAGLPNSPEVSDTLGFVYYKKNLSALAIAAFKESAAKDPENPVYLYHLGLAYAQGDQKMAARTALDKALKLSTTFEGAADARKVLDSLNK